MKIKLYTLTKLGYEKNFNEDFFAYFPEEIMIIDLLKIHPLCIRQIMNKINKTKKDKYKRTIKSRSYDFVLNKIKSLIENGFIKHYKKQEKK